MRLTSSDWSGLIGLLSAFLFMLILFLQSCTTASNGALNRPAYIAKDEIGYELESFDKNIHRYKDDVTKFNLPFDNPKLTQYCLLHYQWENIIAFTTKYGIRYRVRKDK